MGKLAQATTKYTICARFEADGTVEKPDVIGAVFGQTEGLLGPDMELRELQQTGRIGRIKVDVNTIGGKTSGMIYVPSSLDSSETALIAACMETIERVGPCNAKVYVQKIEDVRISKRKYVVERAKELLLRMLNEGGIPEPQEISEQIKEAVRAGEISNYKGLPAGPNILSFDNIIVVEGRADVLNLLRCGIKNVVAIEGTSVPKQVAELSKEKELTAFLDGDRGGDLILKELTAVCDVDFVARAPEGKEVEELTKKEVFKALRDRVTIEEKAELENGKKKRPMVVEEQTEVAAEERPRSERKVSRIEDTKAVTFKAILNELTGTRAAYFLDDSMEILGKVPVKEIFNTIRELEATALLFDGEIDQKLVSLASQKGIKYLVGMKVKGKINTPENVSVLTINDL